MAYLLVFTIISFVGQVESRFVLPCQSSIIYSQEGQVQPVEVPLDIMRKIRERAQLDYPGDQQIQDFVINEQVASYQWLQTLNEPRIPEKNLTSFKQQAAIDHPDDYQIQKYLVKEQMDDYFWIKNYSNPSIPQDQMQLWKTHVAEVYPNNFIKQRYFLEKTIKDNLGLK